MNAHLIKRLAGIALAMAFAFAAQAQNKVAVVDLKKVFDGYWRTRQADTQLKQRAGDLEKARTGMVEDYKKANDEFKKSLEGLNDPSASAEEKERRKKEAEKKQGDLREIETSIRTFDETSRKTILEQQKRMRDSVLRDIRGIVEEKAKAGGYTVVFDTAAESINQTPVVVYTTLLGGSDDLSEGVLKTLNANAPPEGAAPPAEEKKEEKK